MNILTDFVNILRNEPATLLAVIIFASILFLIFLIPSVVKHSKNLKKTKFRLINWQVGKPVYAVAGLIIILTILSTTVSIWTNKDYVAGRLGLGPEIAVKIGDALISLESVNTIAKHCKILGIDNELEAAELLVDDNILSMWAADEGIVVSKQEQKAEELRISGKQPVVGCTDVHARVNLLREKLAQTTKKYREGQFIVVNFGRYNPSSFYTGGPSKAKREKLRKDERAYADKLIQSIYQDLKSNNITFKQGIEKAKKDPRTGFKSWYATSFQSRAFSALDYINKQDLLSFEEVWKKVDPLSTGQFSKPFVQSIEDDTTKGKPIETRWIIANVKRAGEGSGGSVEGLLNQIRTEYGGKIYL